MLLTFLVPVFVKVFTLVFFCRQFTQFFPPGAASVRFCDHVFRCKFILAQEKENPIFSLVFVRLVKWVQRFDSSYWALSRKKSGPIASLSPNSASSPLNSMSHSDVRSYGGDSWGQLDQAFHWCHMSNSLQIPFGDWWLKNYFIIFF